MGNPLSAKGMSSLDLVLNIHSGIDPPTDCSADQCSYVQGDYHYYHYICDGQDDRGWGCGYRTLQTLCSWLHHQKPSSSSPVPSLTDVQQALVTMGDKAESFLKSREWIGSVEVAMVVDYFFDEPCKIIHVKSGADLKNHVDTIRQHFQEKRSLIMMGGDSDTASKGIVGVCQSQGQSYLLILDPHYSGKKPSREKLIEDGFLIWRNLSSFMEDSFYNLCLCQYTYQSTIK